MDSEFEYNDYDDLGNESPDESVSEGDKDFAMDEDEPAGTSSQKIEEENYFKVGGFIHI